MESTARIEVLDTPSLVCDGTDSGDRVQVFFEQMRVAQARFLEDAARAQAGLGRGTVPLACLAAGQRRLVRQLFDAQRSILTHRAKTNAFVASMASVIEGTHEADSESGENAQREFAALLDTWWSVEIERGQIAIAEAHACTARSSPWPDSSTLIESPVLPPVLSAERVIFLPEHVLAAFDAADIAFDIADIEGIERLLDNLTDSLENSVPTGFSTTPGDGRDVQNVLGEPRTAMVCPPAGPEEAFQQFWLDPISPAAVCSSPVAGRSRLSRIPTRAILPVVAVSAALVAALAMLG